jgi:hypothetical protein
LVVWEEWRVVREVGCAGVDVAAACRQSNR